MTKFNMTAGRACLLALIVLVLIWIVPLPALAWHYMPVLVFAAACAYGLAFRSLSDGMKIGTAVGSIIATTAIIVGSGMVVVPLLGISCLCGALMAYRPKLASVLAVPVLGWLVAANTIPALIDYQLAMHVLGNTEEISTFPVTRNDRNMPRSTAFEYSVRANNDRTREVSRVHIAWLPAGTPSTFGSADGTSKPSVSERCVWQAPLKYNNKVTANKFWNSFWGSVNGIIRIDCTDIKMRVDTISGENAYFLFGADSWVTEILFHLRHPLSSPARKVYWQRQDGTWVMLFSYVTYQPTWSGTMIPVLGGVTEFGSYGGFTTYSPREARDEFLGASLFPPDLARLYGEAYSNFRYGLVDYFWYQQGLLEISDDEAARDSYPHQNSQPHFLAFEGLGPQLVLPFEPKGMNAQALTRVLLVDAVSGKIRGFSLKSSNAVVNGPRTGLQNLHEAAPEWDWDQYQKVEPLIIHTDDDRWYYQVTIINNNHATVGIIVVDGVQLTPVAFERVVDLQEFIKNGKRTTLNIDEAQMTDLCKKIESASKGLRSGSAPERAALLLEALEKFNESHILDSDLFNNANAVAQKMQLDGVFGGPAQTGIAGAIGWVQQQNGKPNFLEIVEGNRTETLRLSDSGAPILNTVTLSNCNGKTVRSAFFVRDGRRVLSSVSLAPGLEILMDSDGKPVEIK